MTLEILFKYLKENKTVTIMALFILTIGTLWGVDRMNQSSDRSDFIKLREDFQTFRNECDLDKKKLYTVIFAKDSTFRKFVISQNAELRAEAKRTDSLSRKFNEVIKSKL